MNIDQDQFMRTLLDSGIHKRLKQSLLPAGPDDFPKNRRHFVEELYQEVVSGEYFPSVPRGFICANKYRNVSRIIPVLKYKDSCIYYFCIKQLESMVAVNRIEGTFGGWRLGNPIASLEEQEKTRAEEAYELDAFYGPYSPPGAFDPGKWFAEWTEFQRITFLRSRHESNECFVEFDIANFYDNINLDLLERKIRLLVSTDLSPVVDLLFVLLRNWNRKFEGYTQKTVGIPQDEVNDCSRILANFYLQDYDRVIAFECEQSGADFVRYADDQILMGSSITDLRAVLYRASIELHKIGLNVNSGKVNEFGSTDHFYNYWGFELFRDLRDPANRVAVNRAFSRFIQRIPDSADDNSWRWSSVLRRLLTVGFDYADPIDRAVLVEFLLQREVVTRLDHKSLKKVNRLLTASETQRLTAIIRDAIETTPFNAFHLNLLRYYGKAIPPNIVEPLHRRLAELRTALV